MLRRKLLNTLATGVLGGLLLFSAGAHAAEKPAELANGVEYKKIPQPQSIAPHSKKVVEVFGYTCPHCYHLEPSVKEWLKTKPADVEFELMPVVFNNPNWIFMAKVFYTAKELGVLDQAHGAFFDALHRDKKDLYSVETIAQFFTQFGVKPEDFTATFKGFKVDQHVRKAQQLTAAYGVEGVPAVIVNGKYLTDVPMAGNKAAMWNVVNQLTLQ
ncbi:thiol:disulfide interchange protein DsbA/DsbL [Thiomicrorhabdus aquaedulcis]|uniref:thiol:disulfide interchange protein DsbA/DsbL n=1 Tax=Thiomicrorhabdus aquaedulcis TaxID=2211106 RepID=UPI000FD92F0B|nr:thiol:disulfide interchange protein DsbA/DsbL [Thiomicrorhabdus aquaedulcis]